MYIHCVYIYIYVYYSVTELSERAMERERKREREMYDVCIIYIYLCVQYIYIPCRIYFCVCVCMYCSIICFRLHKHTHTALVAQMDIVYIPFQWHFKPSNTIATDKYSIFFEIDQWTRHCTQRSNSCNDMYMDMWCSFIGQHEIQKLDKCVNRWPTWIITKNCPQEDRK